MKRAALGPYEVVRKIAAGGMAEVYLARRWGTAGFFREVALKRLFPRFARNEETLALFQREALLLAHFQHPNIPQVYDLGCADDDCYIAMEYVDGPSAADLWRLAVGSQDRLPMAAALSVVTQVAEALAHVHACRDRAGRPLHVVHCDITPHNILVTRDGVAKLIDFGVAQAGIPPASSNETARGTLSYMSPEQIRGGPLDGRSDVFSLGVILYELTTGVRLFRGPDVEVMTTVVEKDPLPPTAYVPDYPAELSELVMAALARDPAARVADADELVTRLESYAVNHGMLTAPKVLGQLVRTRYPDEGELEPDADVQDSPLRREVNGAAMQQRTTGMPSSRLALERQNVSTEMQTSLAEPDVSTEDLPSTQSSPQVLSGDAKSHSFPPVVFSLAEKEPYVLELERKLLEDQRASVPKNAAEE